MITRMRTISVIASAGILMSACVGTTIPGGATERELCRQWGGSLPTRSRADTEQTAREIQSAYATFELACPDFAQLVP